MAEEVNRKLTGGIARLHFAPTITSQQNLQAEGLRGETITVTGNTVIDALLMVNESLKVIRPSVMSLI